MYEFNGCLKCIRYGFDEAHLKNNDEKMSHWLWKLDKEGCN